MTTTPNFIRTICRKRGRGQPRRVGSDPSRARSKGR